MFDRKGTPFVYLPFENSTFVIYLTLNKPKSDDGLLGASYPDP